MAEMNLIGARAEAERRVREWLDGRAIALEYDLATHRASYLTGEEVEQMDPADASDTDMLMRAVAKIDYEDRMLPAIQSVLAGRLRLAESGLDEHVTRIVAVTGLDAIVAERPFMERVALRGLATWRAERMAFEAGKVEPIAAASVASLSFAATPASVAALPVETPTAIPPKHEPDFFSFWDLYVTDKRKLGEWKADMAANASASKKLFLGLVGDVTVAGMRREKVAEFRSSLLGLPANYNKDRKWADMTLPEIIAAYDALPEKRKEEIPTLSKTTLNKHLTNVGTYFNWLQTTGRLDENPKSPFGALKAKRKRGRAARDERPAWPLEMQKDLFGSAVWNGCKSPARRAEPGDNIFRDALFWLPILGRTMGARSNEICSRKVGDCRVLDGVRYLAISDTKNEASRRDVPFPQVVLDLGFFEYRVWGRDPDEPLFPELIGQGLVDRESEAFGNRFAHYRKTIKCSKRLIDFHSFRHNVTTDLDNAGVKDGWIDEITGHSSKERESETARYKKGVLLKKLKRAIDRVKFPVDISHLRYDGPRGAPAPGAREAIATFRSRAEREMHKKHSVRGRNQKAETGPLSKLKTKARIRIRTATPGERPSARRREG